MGFPDDSAGKESTCNAGDTGDMSSIPGLGRSPGEGMGNPPVVLPGKSHEHWSVVCYSHWDRKDMPGSVPWTSLVVQLVKNQPAMRESWVRSWVGKIPWRKGRLPTPVFWPGEFHGLYSSWGRKELDMAEHLSLHFKCSKELGVGQ